MRFVRVRDPLSRPAAGDPGTQSTFGTREREIIAARHHDIPGEPITQAPRGGTDDLEKSANADAVALTPPLRTATCGATWHLAPRGPRSPDLHTPGVQTFAAPSAADLNSERGRLAVAQEYIARQGTIVDDLALDAMDAQGSRDAYDIFTERHRSGSMIVSSNGGPEEWRATFTDSLRAQSALNRFTNAAYDLVIEGDTYRTRQKPKRGHA